ncbi:hypothetical protein SDC9_167894 [bioreactor metagenome]|uniref:Uncharacterized protein n=1 Tax=bioreactor metagenome TaxID=1076179 RepID=A0A645G1J8_9ZZZZ
MPGTVGAEQGNVGENPGKGQAVEVVVAVKKGAAAEAGEHQCECRAAAGGARLVQLLVDFLAGGGRLAHRPAHGFTDGERRGHGQRAVRVERQDAGGRCSVGGQ